MCGVLASCMICLITPANLNKNVMVVQAAEPSSYSAVFDAGYYATHNPDVVAAFGKDSEALLNHFITYGMKEGRQGNSNFNVMTYKANYADLQAAFGNDLTKYYLHYIEYGQKEGRVATSGSVQSTRPAIVHMTQETAKAQAQALAQAKQMANQATPATQAPIQSYSADQLNDPAFASFKSGYFNKSVFIGDSVMTGFRNYSEYSASSNTHSSKFLENVGIALYNASSEESGSSKHPS